MADPTAGAADLILFGATGDLALRMLYPSLYFLHADGLLAPDVRVIGASRSQLSRFEFLGRIESAVRDRADGDFSVETWRAFSERLDYCAGDASKPDLYQELRRRMKSDGERVFYLSTSPSLYGPIIENLKAAGLSDGDARVVVEKPLGKDLRSCRQINDALGAAFPESRIFRIDHYLGKEAVQNLLALRFANTLFEPLWNKVSIDHVQITVAETVGVEGRFSYYDEYGAIRDMVQNHLLQLLCLVAMEPPAGIDAESVRNEKVKVLRSLKPIAGRDVERSTVRGQYRAGEAKGRPLPGYTEEEGASASDTETFVAISASIENWRWAGVPFYLRTGKRMPERVSEIIIQFREVPHSIFGDGQDLLANRLVIRLQPEEEISLSLMNKTPELTPAGGMELKPLSLNLSLDRAFRGRRRIAYERLLLEAIRNDATLFVRRDEAEAAWSWIDGIVEGWVTSQQSPEGYAAGGWGPTASSDMLQRSGRSWFP